MQLWCPIIGPSVLPDICHTIQCKEIYVNYFTLHSSQRQTAIVRAKRCRTYFLNFAEIHELKSVQPFVVLRCLVWLFITSSSCVTQSLSPIHYQQLPTHYNCPIHYQQLPHTLLTTAPFIALLCCHVYQSRI